MSDYKERTREFLSRFFSTSTLGDGDDIFASGLVNSLLAVQLIVWMERDFSVSIGDEDLQLDNFRSIDAIGAFISRKKEKWAEA